jgi:glycosyltransferase involved in cell wall biosynthesis
MLTDECSDPIGVKSTIRKQHCSRFQAGHQGENKSVGVKRSTPRFDDSLVRSYSSPMPTVLFVHNGSQGRFSFVAHALLERGWRGMLLNGPAGRDLPGMPKVGWQIDRGTTPGILDLAIRSEADLIRGRAAAVAATKLKASGFVPDMIIGHPGWGEMAFLREVFPKARQIQVGEFYYRSQGADTDFDSEFGTDTFEERLRIHGKNAVMAMSYAEADRIVVPTPFQASLFPPIFHPRIAIIHEGIDAAKVRPQPQAQFRLPDGRSFDRSGPIVTFANRYFEPLRGYHIFMRALPQLLRQVPEAQVLVIGSEEPRGYGRPAPAGKNWKNLFLEEVQSRLDMSRVHFTGTLSYDQFIVALSISAAHVYWTYPFVLSWSLLDAMACECLVVGSDTAPVRDVIKPDINGLLVDFFDHEGLAAAVTTVCREPQRFVTHRRAARQTVLSEYERVSVCKPAWLNLIDQVMLD